MFVKIIAFAVVGLLLLLLNVIYIQRLFAEWNAIPKPPVVSPVQVLGRASATTTDGHVMARLVIARVADIDYKLKRTVRTLTHARPGYQKRLTISQSNIPTKLYQLTSFADLDAKITMGGVEVKGLLAWMQRIVSKERVIDLSVQYSQDSFVVAVSPTADVSSVWSLVRSKDESDVTEQLAWAVYKRLVSDGEPTFENVTVDQFKDIVGILHSAAQLNERKEDATAEEYRTLLKRIDDLSLDDQFKWVPLADLPLSLRNAPKI